MSSIFLFEVLFDIAKLAIYIAFAYFALNIFLRHRRDRAVGTVAPRRLILLAFMAALVVGIKIFEDVVTEDSAQVDEAILWFVRSHVPLNMLNFFALVTFSGSGSFLVLATICWCGAWLLMQHRREAAFLATTMLVSMLCIYMLKMLVDRIRPELWDGVWYWGSSFPSGHTLGTAAFATSTVLSTSRIWPRLSNVAQFAAIVWISVVGLSRLVLGVHWPTDVLASICFGICISIGTSLLFDRHQKN